MLLMKDIIRDDDPVLRLVAKEVDLPLSKEDEDALINIADYLGNSQDQEIATKYGLRPGVGLAAPQINISKQMLGILAYDEEGKDHQYLMVNPKLISYSDEMTYLPGGEGCLSVDRVVEGYVPRYKKVTVDTYLFDYDTKELKKAKLRLKNYIAIVFQHEYDHLKGIMFYDRINQTNPFAEIPNSTPIKFEQAEEQKDS
jgi:peptide deformylase